MARVLILDGHSSAALAFTRSLGRAGHWIAVGSNRGLLAPAAVSRYCQCSFEYPVSTDDVAGFVDAVYEFCRNHAIAWVAPMTDWTTVPLSWHRTRFEGLSRLVLPSATALESASDKYRTIELARALGVPEPKTWLVHSAPDLDTLPGLEFPVVVKDRFSARWLENRAVLGSVSYAYSEQDLREKVEERLREAGDVLVQEFVGGEGVGFSCFALDGEAHLPFEWLRVREVDPRGSGSSLRKSVAVDSQVREFSQRLIRGAGFQGIAMVEFKRMPEGRLVLMEINGRPWGSIQLPISAGLDYPGYLLDWVLQGKIPPREIPYKTGIFCRRLVGDLTHLEHLRLGKPAGWPRPYPNFWSSLVRMSVPWYPGLRYDDLWVRDPRPGLAGLRGWLQQRVGNARSR